MRAAIVLGLVFGYAVALSRFVPQCAPAGDPPNVVWQFSPRAERWTQRLEWQLDERRGTWSEVYVNELES